VNVTVVSRMSAPLRRPCQASSLLPQAAFCGWSDQLACGYALSTSYSGRRHSKVDGSPPRRGEFACEAKFEATCATHGSARAPVYLPGHWCFRSQPQRAAI